MGREISVSGLSRSPELHLHGWGNLDAQVEDGGIKIHGWGVGSKRKAIAVELLDEAEAVLDRLPICLERPDVVARLGDVPGAARSGFKARLEPVGGGEAVLTLRILFDEGSPELLGTIRVSALESPDAGTAPKWISALDTFDANRVLVGREGWLFLQNDRNDVLGQHTGKVKYDEGDREALRGLIRRRRHAVEEAGAVWLTAVVPDKETVYADFLPPEIVLVDRRPVHEFLEISEELGAPTIYLLDQLRAARSEGEVYMKTDTHWNHRGSFAAYEAICREIAGLGVSLEVVDRDSLEWMEAPAHGDLGSKLYPEVVEGAITVAVFERRSQLIFDNKIRNHGRVLIYEQPDRDDLPTCMVFGESFAPALLVFLKESFRRLVFLHTDMLVAELVERERPDVVLNLPIERYLIRVPDDDDALARLVAVARGKGDGLPWSVAE